MMQFQFQLLSISLLLSLASALINIQNRPSLRVAPSSPLIVYSSSSEEELSPCWQDIYDADCTMDSFSARFVASDWIKELPCVQGLGEECAVPFPEETQLPGIRRAQQSSPVDITNVMDFLNIKRVVNVDVDVEKK